MKTANENTLIYSGREDEHNDHKEGLALLYNKNARKSLLEWQPISDTTTTAILKTKDRPVTLAQCYAPTEMANNEEKDKFYSQIQTVLRSIKKQDIIIIMGDLSDQLGDENEGTEIMMRKHGLGKLNDNRKRLYKKCHKISWISTDSRTQNQIDNIAASKA
jgi:hypothetical protein